jgi:hypothetical protein
LEIVAKAKMAGRVSQAVGYLPNGYKALSSTPSIMKEEEEEEEKRR